MKRMGGVTLGSRRVCLPELRERAARAACGFERLGLGEESTIALLLRNDICFLEVILASALIGAHSVPINWHFTPREIRQILDDSNARVLVVHADLLSRLRDALPPDLTILVAETPPECARAYRISDADCKAPSDATVWDTWVARHPPTTTRRAPRGSMFYTSGSTGRPKGVRRQPVPERDREALARQRAEWFGHRPAMRTAMIGPMYHSVQSSYALAAVTTGGEVELLPQFAAAEVLATIERCQITHLHLVPTMMRRLLQLEPEVRARYDLSSLEFVIHGAAPCPVAIKRAFIEWWGEIVYEYYGTTEAGMITRVDSRDWLARPGTVGRPWPGRVVRIYDVEGRPVPANTPGVVFLSLGMLPDFTYHGQDAQRIAIERDGLITNGDIGYLDDDGYLYLCDRATDMLISGGANVYPAEIEAILAEHPAVADSAVVGVPDEDMGEVPWALVQLVDGQHVTSRELDHFMGERLARFKIPRRIIMVDALPRDDSGKIFKRKLKDELRDQRVAER